VKVFRYKIIIPSLVRIPPLSRAHPPRHPMVWIRFSLQPPEGRLDTRRHPKGSCVTARNETASCPLGPCFRSDFVPLISPRPSEEVLDSTSLTSAVAPQGVQCPGSLSLLVRSSRSQKRSERRIIDHARPQEPKFPSRLRAEPHNAYFSRQRTRREGVPSR